jgi:cytochrome P450
MTDLDIRNNFIGLLIGAIPTSSKCAALTLDYLLSHPELLADARRAARADDDATMIQYVQECIRLSPFAAGIQRICAEDYVVAQGSWRATKIPKGTVVLAATQSAMVDWRKIRKPSTFRLDRPAYSYLHFGAGLHTCFGQYINLAQIPGIVKAVLKREGLRRVSPMKSTGPFPTNLEISVT